MNRKIIRKLRRSAILLNTSNPFLSPLLLASFSVLNGFMTMKELVRLLSHPLSALVIILTTAGGVFLATVPIGKLQKKFSDSEPTWSEWKRFNHTMLRNFIFTLPITITGGILNLTVITPIEFPRAGLFVSLLITAFYLMISVPLTAVVNLHMDHLTKEKNRDEELIFNIRFKLSLVIFSSFIGTILMFILTAVLSSTSQFLLHRELPLSIPVLFMIIGTTAVFFMLLMVYLIMKNIVDPLQNMVTSFKTGASGDMTVQIPVLSTDEIGLVSQISNTLFSNLNRGFSSILKTTRELEESKKVLGEGVNEMASAVTQIRQNLEQTNLQMEDHSSSVIETTTAVEQLARNIDSLDESIQQQKRILNLSSDSLKELLTLNDQLTDLSRQGVSKTEILVSASKEGNTKIHAMQEMVNKITDDSRHLAEANTLIAQVASKTNLLAMNAAIEAAHAGDAGKGFAVVADEIRKLAETASNQSKSIGVNLKQVLDNIENVGKESKSVQSTFQEIDSHVEDVQIAVDKMGEFTTTVSSFSTELDRAISELEQVSESVIQGSKEMQIGNSEILKAITNMRDINQRVQEAVREISVGADEIAEQSAFMLDQNRSTDESLENVVTIVNQYKIS